MAVNISSTCQFKVLLALLVAIPTMEAAQLVSLKYTASPAGSHTNNGGSSTCQSKILLALLVAIPIMEAAQLVSLKYC